MGLAPRLLNDDSCYNGAPELRHGIDVVNVLLNVVATAILIAFADVVVVLIVVVDFMLRRSPHVLMVLAYIPGKNAVMGLFQFAIYNFLAPVHPIICSRNCTPGNILVCLSPQSQWYATCFTPTTALHILHLSPRA